jgi:hypothetical protein
MGSIFAFMVPKHRLVGHVADRVTRGKTAPERLRRVDVLATLLGLPSVRYPLVVDVGFGADVTTTLETYSRLRSKHAGLFVVGVENDRERVANATPFAIPGAVEFRYGGFDLPLRAGESPGLVRAMNVLRQYPEGDYDAAVEAMAAPIAPGGALLEGTSSPTGRIMTINVWRRDVRHELVHDGIVLSVNLRRDWMPRELQSVLAKNWIHHAAPGSPLDEWFGAWERATDNARSLRLPARRAFTAAARHMRDIGYDIDLRPALLARGFLLTRWR